MTVPHLQQGDDQILSTCPADRERPEYLARFEKWGKSREFSETENIDIQYHQCANSG